MLRGGADRADVVRLARAAAYEAISGLLYRLSDPHTDHADGDVRAPYWLLAEVDAAGVPTGRTVDALYEDLLGLDPSGRDGDDLWS